MSGGRIDLPQYLELRAAVTGAGYGREIHWAQTVAPVSDPLGLRSEYARVVLNSGMRSQVPEAIVTSLMRL